VVSGGDEVDAILEALLQDVERFIEQAIRKEDHFDDDFDALAQRLFAFQYERNAPYRAFCFQRGKTPRTVRTWKDIPAVPIRAFKTNTLSCLDPSGAEAVFMTSGTTNPEERGRHIHPTLRIYDRSMRTAFREYVMVGRERIRMGILFPAERLLPNSSLAHYLALAVQDYGSSGSEYLVDGERLDLPRLRAFTAKARQENEPIALLGATFSFVHVLDQWYAAGERLALSAGSFLLDTGGTKGRSREIAPESFYRQASELFGVPKDRCLNMYGMTELSTQFYDTGNASSITYKIGPQWIRTRAVDPVTGQDVRAGEPGVLAHCDLANWNSVTTIITEDLGIMSEDGRRFQLLGRATGSAARGCSLAAEAFQQAAERNNT
jgi:acyl-CoA synthetase (AMP-forming)/AMP-acid ligase II